MSRRSVRLRAATLMSVVGLASGLVLAACGGDGATGGAAAPNRQPAASGAAALLHPSAKAGGTLRALSDSDCDYWDPARTYYAYCWNQQRWFSRQLLTYAAHPRERRNWSATSPNPCRPRRTGKPGPTP